MTHSSSSAVISSHSHSKHSHGEHSRECCAAHSTHTPAHSQKTKRLALSSGGSLPELVHDSCNIISVAINNQSESITLGTVGTSGQSVAEKHSSSSKGAVVGNMIVDKLHGLSEKFHQLSHPTGSDHSMSTSSSRTRAGTCKYKYSYILLRIFSGYSISVFQFLSSLSLSPSKDQNILFERIP